MGKQDGLILLKGSVGGLSFYKTKEGYIARKKTGLDGNRVKHDPAFARTRENMAEFGRAGAATKVLRMSLRSLIQRLSDSRSTGRLNREMLRVIWQDETNIRGQRNVIDGDVELLTGFEFNVSAKLPATLSAPIVPAIDRVAGTLRVEIPAFAPQSMVRAPQGATHFRLVSAGAEVDFVTGAYVVQTSETEPIILGTETQEALQLSNAVPANSTHPLVLAFGIEFLQEVNGQYYPLKSGESNSLALIAVSGGV